MKSLRKNRPFWLLIATVTTLLAIADVVVTDVGNFSELVLASLLAWGIFTTER